MKFHMKIGNFKDNYLLSCILGTVLHYTHIPAHIASAIKS